jgi:hypothetical protein
MLGFTGGAGPQFAQPAGSGLGAVTELGSALNWGPTGPDPGISGPMAGPSAGAYGPPGGPGGLPVPGGMPGSVGSPGAQVPSGFEPPAGFEPPVGFGPPGGPVDPGAGQVYQSDGFAPPGQQPWQAMPPEPAVIPGSDQLPGVAPIPGQMRPPVVAGGLGPDAPVPGLAPGGLPPTAPEEGQPQLAETEMPDGPADSQADSLNWGMTSPPGAITVLPPAQAQAKVDITGTLGAIAPVRVPIAEAPHSRPGRSSRVTPVPAVPEGWESAAEFPEEVDRPGADQPGSPVGQAPPAALDSEDPDGFGLPLRRPRVSAGARLRGVAPTSPLAGSPAPGAAQAEPDVFQMAGPQAAGQLAGPQLAGPQVGPDVFQMAGPQAAGQLAGPQLAGPQILGSPAGPGGPEPTGQPDMASNPSAMVSALDLVDIRWGPEPGQPSYQAVFSQTPQDAPGTELGGSASSMGESGFELGPAESLAAPVPAAAAAYATEATEPADSEAEDMGWEPPPPIGPDGRGPWLDGPDAPWGTAPSGSGRRAIIAGVIGLVAGLVVAAIRLFLLT